MNFHRFGDGPFDMDKTKREEYREDKPVPNETAKRKRKKIDILKDLGVKTREYFRGFLSVEEVHTLAGENEVPIVVEEQKIKPRWVDKSKGLLQVLWERGWIDKANLSKCIKEGRKQRFDESKNTRHTRLLT
jgi:hypothetical protein